MLDLWDVAWDEGDERVRDWCGDWNGEWVGGFAKGAEWGAGWAFAIIGMFEAIRKNAPRVKRCSSCGYDPFRDGDHPNDAYDNTIYKCEGGLFCGECADQLGECDVD